MDSFLIFWGLVLTIGLILFFGIPYLIYFTLKWLGKPRLGKIIGLFTLTIFSLFTTYVVFEDVFFFKYSAKKELKELDLVLNDNFEIIKNESGGFTDYYHIFELRISNQDVKRLIKTEDSASNVLTIKHKDFKDNGWKEVKIDKQNNILTFEHVID